MQDTFAVPVNLKEHVTVDNSDEPITVCKNGWAKNIFGSMDPNDFYPCVSVAYDTVSMRGYSLSGFGENYCAENDDQFVDKVQGACFWGGIAGAVAVSCMSGPFSPVTMQVTLPVAIGSGGTACEKLVNMGGKWPHSQY